MDSFTAIDNKITSSDNWKSLSFSARVVYMRLRTFSDIQNKAVWPAMETLAGLENCSRTTISKAIGELINHNLIKTSQKGRKYLFHFLDCTKFEQLKEPNVQILDNQCTKTEHGNVQKLNTNNINKPDLKNVDLVPKIAAFSVPKQPDKPKTNQSNKLRLKQWREKLVTRLQQKEKIFLTQDAIDKIMVLSINDMTAYWYQYENDKANNKVDDSNKTQWWNKNLESDHYDLGFGYKKIKGNAVAEKRSTNTKDFIENELKVSHPPIQTDGKGRVSGGVLAAYHKSMEIEKDENIRIEQERRDALPEDLELKRKIQEIREEREKKND